MADLFGSNEPEDMSSFLQILLNNSSSSAAPTDTTVVAGGLFSGGGGPAMGAECSSRISFSNYNSVFAKDSDGAYPSGGEKNLDSSREGSEASESPVNPVLQRSSKRSRAAEVHNLSEKRRRSRINEKLKALQNLIPNSNKTDKASMLDEAIEYLKHLQLQVQMLTMRNGVSLHPGYSLGSLQSMTVPSARAEIGKGNVILDANRTPDALPPCDDILMQSHDLSSSTHSMLLSSMTNSTDFGILPGYVPSMQNHYGSSLNHLNTTKDICRDDTLSRLQLDIGCSGNSSSPGVSS